VHNHAIKKLMPDNGTGQQVCHGHGRAAGPMPRRQQMYNSQRLESGLTSKLSAKWKPRLQL
jgi:hypothetical protein